MPIITLTTDLGLKDHYVASVKGAILSQIPDINIVDIILIVNHILENILLTDYQVNLADFNNDSLINVVDIIILVNIILEEE